MWLHFAMSSPLQSTPKWPELYEITEPEITKTHPHPLI